MELNFRVVQKIISASLVVLIATISWGTTAPQPALAKVRLDLEAPRYIYEALHDQDLLHKTQDIYKSLHDQDLLHKTQDIYKVLRHNDQLKALRNNKQLVANINYFLSTTPEVVCQAYFDMQSGEDTSMWEAIEEGAASTAIIANAIASASSAGAGSLAGYSGMAAAVSQLGLGGVTTVIANLLGSSATGAAATAVVTSTVGGPFIMGAVLIGGTGATAFGTYKLSQFAVEKLGHSAEHYCLQD